MNNSCCLTHPCSGSQEYKETGMRGPNPSNDTEEETPAPTKIDDLSVEEREKGLYDLHGVSEIVEETVELVALNLKELDRELGDIPNPSALHLAMKQAPNYVKNMRLVFLRAERFDAKQASHRMRRFFEIKRNAFGEKMLSRDITWADLSEEDKRGFEIGAVQLLPERDSAGRALLFFVGPYTFQVSAESKLRLTCFLITMISKDIELQKRGMVFVSYHVGQVSQQQQPQAINPIVSLLISSPIRLVGLHLCYDNPMHHAVSKLIGFALNTDVCRYRAHFGSHLECLYSLMTFGIVGKFMPISPDGELRLRNRDYWLKKIQKDQVAVTEEADSTSVILVPGPFDVLMGRGRHSEGHMGNLRFKYVLDKYQQTFEAADRYGKPVVSRAVLTEMKNSGSLFIKKVKQNWVEVSDEVAQRRISHAFRNLRAIVVDSTTNATSKGDSKKRERQSDLDVRDNVDWNQ